jgi:hypothetical protein
MLEKREEGSVHVERHKKNPWLPKENSRKEADDFPRLCGLLLV